MKYTLSLLNTMLTVIICVIVNLSLTGCGANDDEPNPNNPIVTPDPSDSKTVTLPRNGTPISLGDGLYNTNYLIFRDNQIGGVYCKIADLGEFSNLGSVKGEFPANLSTMNQWAVAQTSHGYIVKFNDEYNTIYCRALITKAVTGIDGNAAGIEVKYEYDWQEPFNVPIEFNKNNTYSSTYYKNGEMKWNYIWYQIAYINPVVINSIKYDRECEYIDNVLLKNNCLIICFDVEHMPNNWSGTFEVSNNVNSQSITLKRRSSQYFDIVE